MTREDQILGLMPTTLKTARWFAKRLPSDIDRSDIESEAMIGMIQAVDRFDVALAAKAGASLRTFAHHRIVGAIRDYLRRSDPLSRDMRQADREKEADHKFRIVSVEKLSGRAGAACDDSFTAAEMRTDIRILSAVSRLTKQERFLVALVARGATYEQSSACMGLSKSRGPQIMCAAMRKLRKTVRSEAVSA